MQCMRSCLWENETRQRKSSSANRTNYVSGQWSGAFLYILKVDMQLQCGGKAVAEQLNEAIFTGSATSLRSRNNYCPCLNLTTSIKLVELVPMCIYPISGSRCPFEAKNISKDFLENANIIILNGHLLNTVVCPYILWTSYQVTCLLRRPIKHLPTVDSAFPGRKCSITPLVYWLARYLPVLFSIISFVLNSCSFAP